MLNVEFYEKLARIYDAEHATKVEDLALYSELADETGGPILDVGCGSGRVMLALAQEGHRVVGIDNAQAMLDRGQRHLDQTPQLKPLVTFVKGDALTTPLPDPFKLIIVPYNTFMHFEDQATQIAALRRFHELLDKDGMLVIDLPNASEAFGSDDVGSVVLERTFDEPETGRFVMQHSVSSLERITQQLHVTWIYDEIGPDGLVYRTLAPLILRYVFTAEMDLMLELTGFHRLTTYGDDDQMPFEEGCPRMIVLAEKA